MTEDLQQVEEELADWFRIEGEPADKYAYFQIFRNTPPEDRKLSTIAKDIAKRAGKNERTVRDWARIYSWEERALAYDVHKDQQFIEQMADYQREVMAEERELLHLQGIHLRKQWDRATAMTVERSQLVEDEDNPGQMIRIVDRAINSQETVQLGRATNQHIIMRRRSALLPTSTTTKYLEDATLDTSGIRRKVTIAEEWIDDGGGFESQAGKVEVRSVQAPKVIEAEVVKREVKDAD